MVMARINGVMEKAFATGPARPTLRYPQLGGGFYGHRSMEEIMRQERQFADWQRRYKESV
jgi:hypothetical protein